MRYVVLFIGLVGAVESGFIGYQWMDGFNHQKVDMAEIRQRAHTGFYKEEALEKIAEFDLKAKAWPFLLTGAVLGLLGSILAYERRRFSGSALLLCAALGPVVYQPSGAIFAFGLVVAGLLALFIRPRAATGGPANGTILLGETPMSEIPASQQAGSPEPAEETDRPTPSLATVSAAEKTGGQAPPDKPRTPLATSGSEEPNPNPTVSEKTKEAGVPEKVIQPGPGGKSESAPASSESVSEEPNSRGRNAEKSTPSRKGLEVLLGIGVAVLVVAYLGAFGAGYYGLIGASY